MEHFPLKIDNAESELVIHLFTYFDAFKGTFNLALFLARIRASIRVWTHLHRFTCDEDTLNWNSPKPIYYFKSYCFEFENLFVFKKITQLLSLCYYINLRPHFFFEIMFLYLINTTRPQANVNATSAQSFAKNIFFSTQIAILLNIHASHISMFLPLTVRYFSSTHPIHKTSKNSLRKNH